MRRFVSLLAAFLLSLLAAQAQAANGYNASGSCTRPSNTTAYTNGTLYGCQSSGNTVAMTVTVPGTTPGANFIVGARLSTTGTSAQNAQYRVFLYASSPTVSGLSDQSAYAGPFAADLGPFVGSYTCTPTQPTSDASPQFFAECVPDNTSTLQVRVQGAAGSTTLFAMVEVTAGYTPLSAEVLTLRIATVPVP